MGSHELKALGTSRTCLGHLGHAGLGLLPQDMSGMDVIELGCGSGYVSAWMTRRGARATGIDISSGQLATARRLAAQHEMAITFIEGDAEEVDRPDQSFDFAISEYGAAIWCDPEVWLREAWRLLRSGGSLVLLGNHPLTLVCTDEHGNPCDFTLRRPYRDMRIADWTEVEIDLGGIEFNLTTSSWLKLFREIGFVVENYCELYAPDSASGVQHYVPAEWARMYPNEQVWWLRKPA